ncbi:hypothetical protein [Phocoenobacter skyensis]|uniref:Phage protein n=1 Tax=Phocoenobacter skyensis TaxID=97481 RepID=A0ABT9JN42_9PAST|nr:hypothetical protein [Pasteurella skyensis]MDP8080233.1 hypothetical protein [Pasteurella skyensis]MDP8086228.1 hypothetical protein [Pasteurella skyensis]
MIDKARREGIRWNMLNVLHKSAPYPITEEFLKSILNDIYPNVTKLETRQHLDYLASYNLINIDKKPYGVWLIEIDHKGTDIVEYTIDCPAGIARPEKYWA